VPGHMNIYDNEKADLAAKIAAAAEFNSENVKDCSNEIDTSLIYLRKLIKKSLLQSWQNYYNSTKKGASYQNLDIQPVWKPPNLHVKTSRIAWSTYIQLKLRHGYFKSYLKRLPDFDSDKCDCNNQNTESSAHLLLDCSKYQAARLKLRERLKINLSLKNLLTTKTRISAVCDFLIETKMARRPDSTH
jgi:hypothetical protein